jgi:hypothetical protein
MTMKADAAAKDKASSSQSRDGLPSRAKRDEENQKPRFLIFVKAKYRDVFCRIKKKGRPAWVALFNA